MPKIERPAVYLGIDPGASGGLACLSFDPVDAVAMPATDRDVWDWIRFLGHRPNGHVFAVIEKVGGYIGKQQPGSAMFKFGRSYGSLCMALTAANIPFEEITPQRWQKGLGITTRKKTETRTQWKNRLKAHAQRLFPSVAVTLATADALLIATYCQRKMEGSMLA